MKKRNISGIITLIVVGSLLLITCKMESSEPVYDVEHYQISASTYSTLMSDYISATDETCYNFATTQSGTSLSKNYSNQSTNDVKKIMRNLNSGGIDNIITSLEQRGHVIVWYETIFHETGNIDYGLLYIKEK